MRRRTRARELALQFLYQLGLRGPDILDEARSFFRAEEPDTFSRYSSWNFERLPILKEIIAEYLSYIPPEPLAKPDYSYDHIGSYKVSPDLRRHYFIHRTLTGYRKARLKGTIRRYTHQGGSWL